MELPGLRALRLRRALSQRDLAERARIGLSTVIRLEHGGTATPLTVERLAQALNAPAEELAELDPPAGGHATDSAPGHAT